MQNILSIFSVTKTVIIVKCVRQSGSNFSFSKLLWSTVSQIVTFLSVSESKNRPIYFLIIMHKPTFSALIQRSTYRIWPLPPVTTTIIRQLIWTSVTDQSPRIQLFPFYMTILNWLRGKFNTITKELANRIPYVISDHIIINLKKTTVITVVIAVVRERERERKVAEN